MKLGSELVDRVVDAVRALLPEGVTLSRRGRASVRIRSKPARYEWAYTSRPAFGHISRRNTPQASVAIALERTIDAVTDHLKRHDLRWQELEWGPVQITTRIDDGVVTGFVTDVAGNQVVTRPIAA